MSEVELDEYGAEQMRRSRRLLLVGLTTLTLFAMVLLMVRPALNMWWVVGDVPIVLGGLWLVLLLLLSLQVSSRVKPAMMALAFLALMTLPGLLAGGVATAYTQFAMERTTATVVETSPKTAGGPIPVVFRLADGTTVDGFTNYGKIRAGYRDVVNPTPGTELAIVRDPNGLLPARNAGPAEAAPEGNTVAMLWGAAALIGLIGYAAWCWSALTRRRSAINASSADEW